MQVRVTDMKETLVIIATVFAAVSFPAVLFIGWKFRLGKRMRLYHGICAATGALVLATVCILFAVKVRSASGNVRGWAEDFFYPYFTGAVVTDAVLTGLFCLAAAIGHQMKRMRRAVTVLLPYVMIGVTLFVGDLASDGRFAVDFYIKALAPGLGLLPHAVMLCEKDKNMG